MANVKSSGAPMAVSAMVNFTAEERRHWDRSNDAELAVKSAWRLVATVLRSGTAKDNIFISFCKRKIKKVVINKQI